MSRIYKKHNITFNIKLSSFDIVLKLFNEINWKRLSAFEIWVVHIKILYYFKFQILKLNIFFLYIYISVFSIFIHSKTFNLYSYLDSSILKTLSL